MYTILQFFLLLVDVLAIYLHSRFMFIIRWDITKEVFNREYFSTIFPQYLSLAVFLTAFVFVTLSFKGVKYSLIVASVLNLVGLLIVLSFATKF